MTENFPLPLTQAIDRISSLVDSLKYARAACIRAMRSERQTAIISLLTAMIESCSLQHDGAICAVNEQWARPKTLQELADKAGLTLITAKRAMADLYRLELVKSSQIKRKNKVTGQLEVSPALRFFTPKFWQLIGLWEVYKKSVAWAKKQARRKLLMPFKSVSCKAKQTAKKAGNIIKTAMGKLPIMKSDPLKKQAPQAQNPASNFGTSTVQLRLAWIKDRLTGGEYTNFEQWLVKNKRE